MMTEVAIICSDFGICREAACGLCSDESMGGIRHDVRGCACFQPEGNFLEAKAALYF